MNIMMMILHQMRCTVFYNCYTYYKTTRLFLKLTKDIKFQY